MHIFDKLLCLLRRHVLLLNAFLLLLVHNTDVSQAASKKELFFKADKIYRDDKRDEIRAEGNVIIDIGDYTLESGAVKYNFAENLVYADQGIKINGGVNKNIYGEKIIFNNDTKQGLIENFVAKFDKHVVIAATYAKKAADKRFELENAVFSPCRTYCAGSPLWQIKAEKATVDYDAQKVTYRNSAFEVYGHRVMYVPYFAHPTPYADAQSGLLVPSIKNKDLLLPFYLRIKPYADLTLSPRISRHYTIFEVEYRQKTENGEFKILADFGNPSDKKLKNYQNTTEEKKIHRDGRFHLKVQGKVDTPNLTRFGYNIDVASDKSYLVNYYNIYDPYLTSEIYGEYAQDRNYTSVKAVGFQELRIDGDSKKSFLTPLINTQHSISLNEAESMLFNVRSNALVYTNSEGASLMKTSIKAALQVKYISDFGHVFNYAIGNRLDAYVSQETNKLEERTALNTPFINAQWRYPLAGYFDNKMVQFEPIVKISVEKEQNKNNAENSVLKNYVTELSESNIFRLDQLNITNNYARNFQASYGANAALSFKDFYIQGFFGQSYYSMRFKEKRYFEHVGNIIGNIGENFSLIYRYRGDKKLRPIRQELEMNASIYKLKARIGVAKLSQIATYFGDLNLLEQSNKISQLNCELNYEVARGWWIGGGLTANIARSKTKLLSRNIHMTYIFDCVSMSLGWTNNLFDDKARGIKKRSFPNFALKLKVLNM